MHVKIFANPSRGPRQNRIVVTVCFQTCQCLSASNNYILHHLPVVKGGRSAIQSCSGQGLAVSYFNIILLWSRVGRQLFHIILLWSGVGGQLFHIRHLWHQTAFTPNTFYTRQLLHNFDTRHLLHQTPFAPNSWTEYTFYTRQLWQQTPFIPDAFYTKQLLHQTLFTPDTFYTCDSSHIVHQTQSGEYWNIQYSARSNPWSAKRNVNTTFNDVWNVQYNARSHRGDAKHNGTATFMSPFGEYRNLQ